MVARRFAAGSNDRVPGEEDHVADLVAMLLADLGELVRRPDVSVCHT
jgi:hypothetical protein